MSEELFPPTGAATIIGNHRYDLMREWEPDKAKVMFIGVNPSRANATFSDNTIIRCIDFARRWGYGGLYFGNLYSFRTPYVTQAQIAACPDGNPEGWRPLMDNLEEAFNTTTDTLLQKMMMRSQKVICAWGSWKFTESRSAYVLRMIRDMDHHPYCLGVNKDGSPKHPLYLSGETLPIPLLL